MQLKPPCRQFDLNALDYLSNISGEVSVGIASFEDEMDKLAGIGSFLKLLPETVGNVGGAVSRGGAAVGDALQGAGRWVGELGDRFSAGLSGKTYAQAQAARNAKANLNAATSWRARQAAMNMPDAPGFLDTHFGTSHLRTAPGVAAAPGAGIKNWWSNTSDEQKLKTLGVAGLGAAGVGLAVNRSRPTPSINMGPVVNS